MTPLPIREQLAWLRDYDQELRKETARLASVRIQTVEQALGEGVPFAHIAKLLGRDRAGLYHTLKRMRGSK
jgi:hypothetical protein